MTIVAMEAKAQPPRPLLHTPEAGDPYYIGDCYGGSSISSEWEIDSRELPYLSHVKSLSSSWRPLRFLADFMEVGTTPLRWKYVKNEPGEREERVRRTNVTYLKCASSSGETISTRRLRDAGSLKEVVAHVSTSRGEDDDDNSTHVFLVEDLSRDVIETLGTAFDIDPFFFREQIDEYLWYNTRDPWAKPSQLIAAMDQTDWFRIRNVRVHYFEDRERFNEARLESNSFNVLRRPDDDDNHWKFLDKPGAVVSLTRTKTSIWTGKTGCDGNVHVGVVLVDPSVSDTLGRPLWHGHTNWLPRPSMRSSARDASHFNSTSLHDMIAEKTTSHPWFARATKTSPQSSTRSGSRAVVAKPALFTIAAEWLHICDYMSTRLGQIEWELEKPGVFRARGDAIDVSLRRLHVWRRVIPKYREMVSETLEQAIPAACRLLCSSLLAVVNPQQRDGHKAGGDFDDIAQDFRRVQRSLNELQARVDRLTAIVTSEMSIEDARRGLEENRNLARLTWIATTFIPLSFVTGLFSMETNLPDLKVTFGWYFAVALPLTILIMLATRYAGGVLQWIRLARSKKTQ